MSIAQTNRELLAAIDAAEKALWGVDYGTPGREDLERLRDQARDAYQEHMRSHHLRWEQCVERFPRLTKMIQFVIIGSEGEAGCCIRDYRDGFQFSGEACSHSGLSPEDRIRDAVRLRHVIRKAMGR